MNFKTLFLCGGIERTKLKYIQMSKFKQYRRKSVSEMRPYVEGEKLDCKVSISEADFKYGYFDL